MASGEEQDPLAVGALGPGRAPAPGGGLAPPRGAGALVEAAIASLRARGQRVTPARRAVLQALATTDAHLRAEDVCALVEPVLPGLHRATVYRTLESLAELGVVAHVHTGHGATVHHLAADPAGDHLHTSCRRCGRVDDVPADLLDDVRRRLGRETGFDLAPQHVALSGVCRDCRARPDPRANASDDRGRPSGSEGA